MIHHNHEFPQKHALLWESLTTLTSQIEGKFALFRTSDRPNHQYSLGVIDGWRPGPKGGDFCCQIQYFRKVHIVCHFKLKRIDSMVLANPIPYIGKFWRWGTLTPANSGAGIVEPGNLGAGKPWHRKILAPGNPGAGEFWRRKILARFSLPKDFA